MEEIHENENLVNGVDLDNLINSLPAYEKQNQEQPAPKEKKTGYKTDSLVFHFLCVFGVVFISIFFVFQIYLTPITVVGESMLPTINSQTTSTTDTSHSDIVYYRAKESYEHGDIVIISNEKSQYIDNSKLTSSVDFLIKRIIACPGDTIKFYLDYSSADGLDYYYKTIVTDKDGNEVDLNEESYIKEPMVFNAYTFYTGNLGKIANAIRNKDVGYYEIKISENCYFAMGDNRNNSSDSRTFGEISADDICGNVRLQVVYGENIWIALFKKLKSYLSATIIQLKENL